MSNHTHTHTHTNTQACTYPEAILSYSLNFFLTRQIMSTYCVLSTMLALKSGVENNECKT